METENLCELQKIENVIGLGVSNSEITQNINALRISVSDWVPGGVVKVAVIVEDGATASCEFFAGASDRFLVRFPSPRIFLKFVCEQVQEALGRSLDITRAVIDGCALDGRYVLEMRPTWVAEG